MSYRALYRTYRPKTFDEVAGQKIIVKTLKNAIEQNKIAHAYIFSGPRGTGKTSIAKIFAKAINCTGTNHPCGLCANCIALEKNNHPDIIEIDAASNNGVDEVRDLIEKVKYSPIEAKYKVYIIDEVHMMTTGAFNALLKTIEEPPEHVIFILATTEPHKVIPTILSRCQRFDFGKVEVVDMVEKLKDIMEQEAKGFEAGTLELIAELADGGMRDALSILDQCLAYVEDVLTVDGIYDVYGIISSSQKVDFIEKICVGESIAVLDLSTKFLNSGADIKRLTSDLIAIMKDSVIYDLTKSDRLLTCLSVEQVKQIQGAASRKQRLAAIELLVETLQKYQYSSNVSSYFELLLLKLLDVFQTKVEPETISKNVEKQMNVSRETSQPQVLEPIVSKKETEQPKEVVPSILPKVSATYDDDYILGLMVGAKRIFKVENEERIHNLNAYTTNIKWAKLANLLLGLNVFVSGENYIVFQASSLLVANQINEIANEVGNQELLQEVFGNPKHIFALDMEQVERVKSLFLSKKEQNLLPQPLCLEDITLVTTSKEETPKDRVIALFGEQNITIEKE
ncbi:MAG: DNA polymerase III subunit gamma/tau [Erysipelotrichaceae bacterium]